MLRSVMVTRIITLSLFIVLTACQGEGGSDPKSALPVKAIKYMVIDANQGHKQYRLSGALRATDVSQLSFPIGGKVRSIYVRVGDKVSKGQPLAALDAEYYESRLYQMKAELAGARAKYTERKENYERQKLIYKKQYISKNTLDKAAAEFEQAVSVVKFEESKVSLAQRDVKLSVLEAPFGGVITRNDVEEFEEVAGTQIIMEIQGLEGLEVDFMVPSSLLSAVAKGAELSVIVSGIDDNKLTAVVTEQGVKADVRGAFSVRAVLLSPGGGIRAGMVADVYVNTTEDAESVLVPESAIVISPGGEDQVFVYDQKTSRVHSRFVEAVVAGINSFEITDGVKHGEIICISGAEFLREGQLVSLYSPDF